MSWVYVPALADSNSASEPPSPERAASVTWRGKPMQPRTLSRAWRTGGFIRRLSGLTLPPSTLNHGVASFIASLRATPVSPTASPEAGGGQTMTDGWSTTSCESSPAFGLLVSSARTCRGTPTGNSPCWSRHWNEWATALRREYSARPKPGQATGESGCSSWPTATARDGRRGVETNEERVARGAHTGTTLNDAVAGFWATPTVIQTREGWTTEELNLRAEEVKAATNQKGKHHTGNGFGQSLAAQASSWPTPATRDYKGANGAAHLDAGTGRKHLDQLPNFISHCLPPGHPTRRGPESSNERRTLNPLFDEWLMGWPIGWTDCGRAATASCHWLPRMRGALSTRLCEANTPLPKAGNGELF